MTTKSKNTKKDTERGERKLKTSRNKTEKKKAVLTGSKSQTSTDQKEAARAKTPETDRRAKKGGTAEVVEKEKDKEKKKTTASASAPDDGGKGTKERKTIMEDVKEVKKEGKEVKKEEKKVTATITEDVKPTVEEKKEKKEEKRREAPPEDTRPHEQSSIDPVVAKDDGKVKMDDGYEDFGPGMK